MEGAKKIIFRKHQEEVMIEIQSCYLSIKFSVNIITEP